MSHEKKKKSSKKETRLLEFRENKCHSQANGRGGTKHSGAAPTLMNTKRTVHGSHGALEELGCAGSGPSDGGKVPSGSGDSQPLPVTTASPKQWVSKEHNEM